MSTDVLTLAILAFLLYMLVLLITAAVKTHGHKPKSCGGPIVNQRGKVFYD